jgi:hypothetical protein
LFLLGVTALQLSAKGAQSVYKPLALQEGSALMQWQLLQRVIPSLRSGASSPATATSKLLLLAAALVHGQRIQLVLTSIHFALLSSITGPGR